MRRRRRRSEVVFLVGPRLSRRRLCLLEFVCGHCWWGNLVGWDRLDGDCLFRFRVLLSFRRRFFLIIIRLLRVFRIIWYDYLDHRSYKVMNQFVDNSKRKLWFQTPTLTSFCPWRPKFCSSTCSFSCLFPRNPYLNIAVAGTLPSDQMHGDVQHGSIRTIKELLIRVEWSIPLGRKLYNPGCRANL